jgi:hypothetical protein
MIKNTHNIGQFHALMPLFQAPGQATQVCADDQAARFGCKKGRPRGTAFGSGSSAGADQRE